MTDNELLDRIKRYLSTCENRYYSAHADSSAKSEKRTNAIVAIEAMLKAEQDRLESGVRGAPGTFPDWVYKARDAIRYQNDKIPTGEESKIEELEKIIRQMSDLIVARTNALIDCERRLDYEMDKNVGKNKK